MRAPQIVALGGGGFSEEPDNPLLDDYILRLTERASPKVCFLPTASGDAEGYIDKFYGAFHRTRCEPSHVTLFRTPLAKDIEAHLLTRDVIYVGGGSTLNMLAVWRLHGLDKVLRQAWGQGVVLCGLSTGSICWFEAGVTDSMLGRELAALDNGLGLLPGSHCPHYQSEPKRRPEYLRLVGNGELPAGLAADLGVGLHFVGTELAAVIASRPDLAAYRVEAKGGQVTETPLSAQFLG